MTEKDVRESTPPTTQDKNGETEYICALFIIGVKEFAKKQNSGAQHHLKIIKIYLIYRVTNAEVLHLLYRVEENQQDYLNLLQLS